MKIIHILHSLKFSGAEIMYVDAASEFQKKGCELTVMATADALGEYAPNFAKAGYDVIHFPMPSLQQPVKLMAYYKKIIAFLKEGHYDVVHIHSSGARFVFAFCAWSAKIQSVYTFHSVFKSRLLSFHYHILQRRIIQSIFNCQFQTISDSVYDNELQRYGTKTVKIYNWYGNSRYYPAAVDEKNVLRKELGIDEKTLVVISVGGCNTNKRHSEILKALVEIKKKCTDILYLHLGSGCTEEEEKDLAAELGVSTLVRFCGNQQNVHKFLIASDVYVMTSQFEGISITTIEAMACKIPTILYDVPGLRDFNKYGKNSVLIPEDYKELAAAILNLKEEEIGTMTESAFASVTHLYNMQHNVAAIYDLYKSKKID